MTQPQKEVDNKKYNLHRHSDQINNSLVCGHAFTPLSVTASLYAAY